MPKILLTNIQSLRPKVDELSVIAANLKVDIICLTETWLTNEIDDCLMNIPGYSIVRNDRRCRRGGGTTIYIRNGLCFSVVPVDLISEIEGTFIDLPSINLGMFCLYIPPHLRAEVNKLTLTNIKDAMEDFMGKYPQREVIVLGDFNDFNVEALCRDFNLMDIIREPTRGKNILDRIMISENLKPVYGNSQVSHNAPIGKSDHMCLVLSPTISKCKFNYARIHYCSPVLRCSGGREIKLLCYFI